MFLYYGEEQSREAQSTVMPLGQRIGRRRQWKLKKERETLEDATFKETGGETYKSAAAASLPAVAFVIPRASVRWPAVVPGRVAGGRVALLRVLQPLPQVVLPSEGGRVGGGRGGRGGGGRRAIALLFALPASTENREFRRESQAWEKRLDVAGCGLQSR